MGLSFTGDSANVDLWYDALEGFTAPSTLIPISNEAQEAISYQTFQKILEFDPYFGEMHDSPIKPSGDIETILQGVKRGIDDVLHGNNMFFRVNLCSPKDVGRECIVNNGEQTLDLLLSSFRLYKGYRSALKNKPMFLVFRELRQFEDEYRCFIEEGQIKAISQYEDSDTVNKALGASALYSITHEVITNLWGYVQNVIQEAGIETAVLDVGHVVGRGFECIEINPFADCTDKCLYTGEEVYTGKVEGQFRYWFDSHVLRTVEVKDGNILHEWDEIVEEERVNTDILALLQGALTERKKSIKKFHLAPHV